MVRLRSTIWRVTISVERSRDSSQRSITVYSWPPVTIVLVSSAAPSHLTLLLQESWPAWVRVSVPSSSQVHWTAAPFSPGTEHRMAISCCVTSRTWPGGTARARELLLRASRNHLPEKSRRRQRPEAGQ